jgi:hypothetical protein
MVLDSSSSSIIKNYISKIESDLKILKYKVNVVKNIFNYREIVLPYVILFSSEYGINVFITYDYSLEDIKKHVYNVIDSYENFVKVANQELSRSNKLSNITMNFYGFFPKLPHDYFQDDLFEADDHPSHLIKEIITNPVGEIKSEQRLKQIFGKNVRSTSNQMLEKSEVMMAALEIFTSTTIPDMSTLVLDEKVENTRLKSMLKRYELDESQIRKIETQNSENRIILAEAGTGKSVILFSKAQRIAALNPGKKILMLAYNNYLVREIEAKRNFENIKESEIDIFTLDVFIKKLYDKYVINKTEIGKFDKSAMVDKLMPFIDKLPKYDGIFIDEIQQFQYDWIDFLFQLLNSHEKGKYCFVLCGDINQSSRNGKKVPDWKKANLPSFQGRRIKLEKKYRSTESINVFTDELVKNIYSLYARNKMEILYELEGEETYKIEYRETNKLENLTAMDFEDVHFFHTEIDPPISKDIRDVTIEKEDTEKENNIVATPRAKSLFDFIKKQQSKGYDLREFVILYPFQKSFGRCYVNDLEKCLKNNDIEISSTRDSENKEYITYDQIKSALTIVSIEKCIGLDFKYVIVIGLDTLGTKPRDNDKNTRFESKIDNLDYEIFRRHISQLYVALTRAKSKLFIEIPKNYYDFRSKDDMYRKLILGDDLWPL